MLPNTSCTVGILLHPGFDLLQLAGPLEALRLAGEWVSDCYRIVLMSLDGGAVQSSTGVSIITRPATSDAIDTLMILANQSASAFPLALTDFACAASASLRRIAGIAGGAWVLAEAGLLDGKRAALVGTSSIPALRASPGIQIDRGRSFVHDRGVWTASGTASGLELTLAMIEQDLGREISCAIAPLVPLPVRSQYVPPPDDAAAAGLGPVETAGRLRIENARAKVQNGREPFNTIAKMVGFRNSKDMRRDFLRVFGQPPQIMRRAARFGPQSAA